MTEAIEEATNPEKEWLKTLVRADFEKTKEDEELKLKPITSGIQSLILEFYQRLSSTDTPDEFDQFYSERLKQYKAMHLFISFLNEYAVKLGLSPRPTAPEFYRNSQEVEKYLFEITEATLGEPQTLKTLQDQISAKYPDLLSQIIKNEIDKTNGKYEDFVNNEMTEIEEKIDLGVEIELDPVISKQLQLIEESKGKIQQISAELNKMIILGETVWEYLIYAMVSPHCPPFYINGLKKRANLHVLLVGDISTAKSEIIDVTDEIAFKSFKIDDSTRAAMEGKYTTEGIEAGVIDHANNGLLCIHEFDKALKEFKLLRRCLDCRDFTIAKGEHMKITNINMTLFCGANPTDDFFHKECYRDQIPFSEGLLSRFDITLPLQSTPLRNNLMLDRLDLFSEDKIVDITKTKEILATLIHGIQKLKGVKIEQEHQKMIKEVFRLYNIRLPRRPFVILRDLETIARFVNVIASANFYNRQVKDGYVYAIKEDIEKAISLWEDLMHRRRQLYEETGAKKELTSIDDIIKKEIIMHGKDHIKSTDLYEIIVEKLHICHKATFYRALNRMEAQGKIQRKGRKNATIILNS
ncbi:hypothetical protein [Candidatus Borrarchaeum sp.]|uniref:hypothetical protein n=1 Tax=Candidatus Borrarchaeum sp. TaxID=2846742 RepID=UPI00257FC52B|nr:hypothetical protein [Candidatus Borrarchaeum sp.]